MVHRSDAYSGSQRGRSIHCRCGTPADDEHAVTIVRRIGMQSARTDAKGRPLAFEVMGGEAHEVKG